ncbi:hypothetical protein D3C83_12850 [compost metagenome]
MHAVTTARFGPLSPYMIESCPEIRLMIEPGTKNGVILRGPPASIALCVSSISGRPPIPEPMHTPICSRCSRSKSSPESLIASIAPASP